MFKTFVDYCFSGCVTDMERLFVMLLVMFVLTMLTEVFVAVVEVGKQ